MYTWPTMSDTDSKLTGDSIPCPHCGGTGSVNCSECGGTGTISTPCTQCGGAGTITSADGAGNRTGQRKPDSIP